MYKYGRHPPKFYQSHFFQFFPKVLLVLFALVVIGFLNSKQMMESTRTLINNSVHGHNNDKAATMARKRQFYSHARKDRSGSAIQDMIYAHGYAYHNNLEYMGACSDDRRSRGRERTHWGLLQGLGLQNDLKFQCPPEKNLFVSDAVYRNDSLLTLDYLNHLRSLRLRQPDDRSPSNSAKVVVHIRRGDVDPCIKGGSFHRYSPNQLYLEVLDRVLKKGNYTPSQVTIFSNAESTESFHDFKLLQYNLELDGTLESAWLTMADAEVFIMSKSSFSMVPYVLID